MKNTQSRISNKFRNELEEIRLNLNEKTVDKHISTREITELIPKHNRWNEIKKDLISYLYEKHG